jgi:hypothetical protein
MRIMAETSTFGGVITFFKDLGMYDVVLPFLLVFTIIFALLEKTKVLGMEDIEGKKYTKKNLNAMTAFVIAFLTIASSKLVEIITTVSSQIVILLLLSVFFLLLAGSFAKEGEPFFLDTPWNIIFMVIMFIGIILIFLSAIKTEKNISWLEFGFNWLADHWSSQAVASIIMLAVMAGIILFVTKGADHPQKQKKEG